MIRKILSARLLAGLCAALISQGWAADSWRLLDPENVLLIETAKGRIVLEMRPDMAPLSVARVKLLSREKLYDGLQFHRVIPGFVAQTGNPDNHDGGASAHPDLALESVFSLTPGHGEQFVSMASDASAGLLGSVPFQGAPMSSVAKPGKTLRVWGAYCAGVAGMGRQESRDSANSEIFFMLDAARRLDRDYTVWGRVVSGLAVLKALTPGEPASPADRMMTVRVLADLPHATRPSVRVLADAGLQALIDETRHRKGADFSVCDIDLPVQITP